MKDHSTMTILEFVFSVIWKFVIGFIWYKNLLFRVLPHHDLYESLKVLFVLSLASILFYLLLFRRWKNSWTATACFVLPFGIYTAITYATTYAIFIRTVLASAFFVSVGYSVLLLTRKVKNKQKKARFKIYKNRILRCVYSFSCILTVALISFMVGIGCKGYFGIGLVASSVEAESFIPESGDDTLEANMDSVLNLITPKWQELDTQGKIDVLQTVCNVEVHYLGLDDTIAVQGDNLSPYTLGVYSDTLKLIQINLDHIENDPVDEVLSTLLHEIHHSYEHRLADAYNSVNPEYRNLRIFRDAAHYSRETSNYINPREDYFGYMSQRLEMDSETYAEYGVAEYYRRIYNWVEENDLSFETSETFAD